MCVALKLGVGSMESYGVITHYLSLWGTKRRRGERQRCMVVTGSFTLSVSHLPKDYVRESGKDLKHAFILCLHLPRTYAHAHTHTCVCACMCVRERKRESSPSTLFEAENILSFPAVHTGIAGLGASGVSHLASGCWCYRSARPCPAFT